MVSWVRSRNANHSAAIFSPHTCWLWSSEMWCCSFVGGNHCFGGMLVATYKTTWCYNSEDNWQIHLHQNLLSQTLHLSGFLEILESWCMCARYRNNSFILLQSLIWIKWNKGLLFIRKQNSQQYWSCSLFFWQICKFSGGQTLPHIS